MSDSEPLTLNDAMARNPQAPYCSLCGEHVPGCDKAAVACACCFCSQGLRKVQPAEAVRP
ncbi:MAG TPA: hypothetical protein VNA25_29325 [Phycisphaerae bacterium]|nr:hypothetical protein [Phycisphaerae bacterium]